MCGIAGFLADHRLGPETGTRLDRMLATLAHRGPDGPGRALDPAAGLAMGHTRLAINDLSATGVQPLSSSDGVLTATVAGEIYGFRQERARLTALGERFATKSDSELVLALYRRHGLDFVDHLRGEFAVVLFDRSRDRLVLVRDRFGVRPLFYTAQPRLFAWASEAKALLAHPGVPRRLSPQAAVNQLSQVMVPGTTAFADVHAVPPGHLLVVERSGRGGFEVRSRKYWDVTFPHEGGWRDDEPSAHVGAVREAVTDALSVRAEADVPIGLYLSGGMDSGALLGMAAAIMQRNPLAFTIGFEDPDYDESGIAAKVAEHVGVDLLSRQIADDDLYDENYVRAVWHSERTFYNTLGIAKMHLSRLASEQGIRVVLSGEGADELFAGYPAFAADHAVPPASPAAVGHGGPHPAALPHAVPQQADGLFVGAILAARPASHPGFERVMGFTPGWVQPWVNTWQRVRPLLADGLLRGLGDYDPLEAVAQSLDASRLEGRGRLDKAQYSWMKTMLDGQILSWGGDRMDMAHGVESRPVLLDHRVAETAVTIPPTSRIRNGTEKWVLREALRHAMPEFLYERRKFAFMAPPAHRSAERARHLSRLIDTYLTPARLAEVGICDPDRTRRFLDALPAAADRATANENDKICNHLLGLHILHDQFIR